MTKIHEGARAWELSISQRFGDAVVRRRKALGISATQLWERTKTLGYPVTRVAISKIENNARNGKLEVAEVFALAAALEIPPSLLLFPDYPDGQLEAIPQRLSTSGDASRWMSGLVELPALDGAIPSPGFDLVRAENELRSVLIAQALAREARSRRSNPDAEMAVGFYAHETQYLTRMMETARAALWGDPDA